MMHDNQHIISKLRWDTYLSSKELATDLQERISSWTKFNFDRTVLPILNRICPPDQSWRIPKMDIDLGEIAYNDLENLLEEILPQKIEEQLLEYLLNPNQHQVEFTSHADRQIDVVEFILINGVSPWWFDIKESFSLNELVKSQLEGNKRDFVQLLFRVGKLEQVRKRLAWQLKEETLINLIHSIEPTYGNQILEITEEIKAVQMRSNLVKASQREFQEGIWLWILNYLFVDRGSFFNQVEFSKSLLIQMAQHFNLNVSDLISHLQSALTSLSDNRQSGLLKVLLTIHQSISLSNTKENNPINYLRFFEENYLQSSIQRFDQQKLSELLIILNRSYSRGVQKLFQKVNPNAVKEFISKIDLNNLHLLTSWYLKGFARTKHKYLNGLLKLEHWNDSKRVEEEVFMFLLKVKPQSTNRMLLRDFLETKYKSNDEIYKNLHQFLEAETKSGLSIDIDLFHDINQLLLEAQVKTDKPSYFERTKGLIKESIEKIKTSKELDSNSRNQLLSRIKIIIQENPKAFYKLLKGWENKEDMEFFIPYLQQEEMTFILLQADETLRKLYLVFKKLQETFPAESRYYTSSFWIFLILKSQLAQSNYSLSKTLFTLIKSLINTTYSLRNQYFKELVKQCSAIPELNFEKESIELIVEINKSAAKEPKQPIELASIKLGNTSKVHDFYCSVHLETPKYLELKKADKDFYFKLNNQEVLQELFKIFRQSSNKIAIGFKEKELRAIFIQTLLDSKLHEFKRSKFLVLLKRALVFHSAKNLNKKSEELSNKELKQMVHQATSKSELTQTIKNFAENSSYQKAFEAVFSFIRINETLKTPDFELAGIAELKNEVISFLDVKITYISMLQNLNEGMLKRIAKSSPFDPILLGQRIEDSGLALNLDLEENLHNRGILFHRTKPTAEELAYIKGIKIDQDISTVLEDCLKNGRDPYYLQLNTSSGTHQLLQLVSMHYPHVASSMLRKASELKLKQWSNQLKTKEWASLFLSLDPQFALVHQMIDQFLAAVSTLSSSRFEGSAIEFCVFKMLINYWKNKRLVQFKSYDCWMEIIHYLGRGYGVSKKVILHEFESVKHKLPVSFQLSYELLLEQDNVKQNPILPNVSEVTEGPVFLDLGPKILTQAIPVKNAGLVLVNNYISRLFLLLKQTEESQFITEKEQWEAAHILQFIVSGDLQTEECHMALNKLLCGLHPQQVIPNQIDLSKKHQDTIHDMIQSIISHWSAIGSSSIMGFRGNWLIRNGMLTELEDFWELTVEKKPYDLLINKSPFSISIIKLPWMEKALKVNWPY